MGVSETTIGVLLVEDSPDDAFLIQEMLACYGKLSLMKYTTASFLAIEVEI